MSQDKLREDVARALCATQGCQRPDGERDERRPKLAPEKSQDQLLEPTFQHLFAALRAIAAQSGTHGTIECPACRRALSWTRATSNRHVWGKCENAGCLEWAQ